MVKNNYSSGRNDDRLLNPNGKNEPQVFVPENEQGEGEHQTDVLACHPYNTVRHVLGERPRPACQRG